MINKMWLLRAGKGAKLLSNFVQNSVIAIGLDELGEIDVNTSKSTITQSAESVYGHLSAKSVSSVVSLVYRFLNDMQVGDYVISYEPNSRTYYFGEVMSEPVFDTTIIPSHPRIRKIKWITQIKRDELTKDTKYQLGAVLTLFQIRGSAREELLNYANTKI